MKIAVLTKSTLADAVQRKNLLKALAKVRDFCIVELGAGEEIPTDADRVLAFGGDGTMLDAAVRCARRDIPLVGVNLGNLGFLTQFDAEASPKDVEAALRSSAVNRRMLISCRCDCKEYLALNDVVVKSASTRPISVELYVNGKFADSYRSDGVIVATPTGSTAYSLSAGGPVVSPDLDAFVVNPVCPHTLHSRPLVIGAASEVELRIIGGDAGQLVIDGATPAALGEHSAVQVVRAGVAAPFVKVGEDGFYEKLLDKMNRWGTTPTEVNG